MGVDQSVSVQYGVAIQGKDQEVIEQLIKHLSLETGKDISELVDIDTLCDDPEEASYKLEEFFDKVYPSLSYESGYTDPMGGGDTYQMFYVSKAAIVIEPYESHFETLSSKEVAKKGKKELKKLVKGLGLSFEVEANWMLISIVS